MDIQFCDQCENMMYPYMKQVPDENDKILYVCKFCNFSRDSEEGSYKIYQNDLGNTSMIKKSNFKMNTFVKFDKTLPKINNSKIQ